MKKIIRSSMLIGFAIVAAVGVLATAYRPATVHAACGSGCVASMSVSPGSGSYNPGNTLTVSVYVNSGGQNVNAVQADFTYPAGLLQYQSINSSGSAFSIDASSTGGSGSVSIARGNISGVSGSSLLVAQVSFQVLSAGTAAISFSGSSAVVSSSSNQDILGSKSGGSYTITTPTPPPSNPNPPASGGSGSGSGGSQPTQTPSSGGVNKKPAPPSSSQPSSPTSTPAPDTNTPTTPVTDPNTTATPAADTAEIVQKKTNLLPTVGLVAGAVVALGAIGAAVWWTLRHRGRALPVVGGTVPSSDFITGTQHSSIDHHNHTNTPNNPGH